MSALDTSLAALVSAYNLLNCSVTLFGREPGLDPFYSVSLQWVGVNGERDGSVEHGKSSSEALQNALAKMIMQRAANAEFAGELA